MSPTHLPPQAARPSWTESRRKFLLGIAAVPTVAALSGSHPEDPEDMAAAARLAGVDFTPEERSQAKNRLGNLRQNYLTLRQPSPPFELAPCSAFDPVPPGQSRLAATGAIPFTIRADVLMPATDTDLAFATVDELASLMRQGKVTSRRLTELALGRLAQFDPRLFCVVTLLREPALQRADELDAELAAGKDRGPLHGIPYGAKDLFGWPGAPTTFGAAPFRDHQWATTATVLQKLHDAGAVLVAKLSLGALAMGDLWHGGRTRNPYNPQQGSSGSSAGPASAVAAGLVPFAIGTETLGSIVSPCRQCGIAGLRPTFGTVSRYGAMPLSWTMDKVGPIARSAVDAALVYDCIRGADGKDPAVRDSAFAWQRSRGLEGLRLGVLQLAGWPKRDEDRAFLTWLEAQGAKLQPVTLPNARFGGMLTMLEAEAATAFDEFVRNGLAAQLPGQGEGDWPNLFRAARTIPAVEYLQASRVRSQLLVEMAAALGVIDAFVAPTHGGPTLSCTNLTGHPTYVLPVGQSAADHGRPTCLALVGKLYGEAELLSVAEAWQNATRWHLARPELTR
jgi:Asp-tRNA(Asn)/Glu-tRNA(Gln) amidotransferase A subunit family amidase